MSMGDGMERYAQRALQMVSRIIATRKLKLTVSGLEHIPASDPVILACRHYHHLYDGVALLASSHRPLHLLVGLDWARPGPLGPVMEAACRMAGWPSILRPDRLRRLRSLGLASTAPSYRAQLERGMEQSLAILRAGEVLVVFPEGHPTVDLHPQRGSFVVQPFKRGFADLAILAATEHHGKVPVVPVAFRYKPQGTSWQVHMEVGMPRWVTSDDSALMVTREIEGAVRRLEGEPACEYVEGNA